VIPRLAAAVVLARPRSDGIEVFMVRRHVQSEFAPDVYVFPGGSVKPADREAEVAPGFCAPAGDGATALGGGLRVAALRELFEEAGVLLAWRAEAPLVIEAEDQTRFARYRAELQEGRATLVDIAAREGLRLATDTLMYWAHWITPEALPRRFDTYFFLVEAPTGQVAEHDELEVTDGLWIAPSEALARHAQGGLPLVFATIHQLRALAVPGDLASIRARFTGREPEAIMPLATPTPDGGFLVKLPGDPGEPVLL
jgi:8-oxo-dGTP pyrophosphatase MutT (NUDIX family)